MRNNIFGFALFEKTLEDMERQGITSMPSLNHWLDKHNLYMQKQDVRALRFLLKAGKKYKLVRVVDYKVVRRGKKK